MHERPTALIADDPPLDPPLVDELDAQRFAQIHRSTIVNLHQVAQVLRGPNENADVQLEGRQELLTVSRSYLHLFRQM